MVPRDWGGIFFGAAGRDGAEPRGKGNGRLVGEGLVWCQRYAELRSPVSELHQVFVCQDVIGPQPLAVDERPIGASQIPQNEQFTFAEYRGVSAGDVEILVAVEGDGAQWVPAECGVGLLEDGSLALTVPREKEEPGLHGSGPCGEIESDDGENEPGDHRRDNEPLKIADGGGVLIVFADRVLVRVVLLQRFL